MSVTSEGIVPTCASVGKNDTWIAAVSLLPASRVPICHRTCRVELLYETEPVDDCFKSSHATAAGKVASTTASASELKPFCTESMTVYWVTVPATGGTGPMLANGPLEYSVADESSARLSMRTVCVREIENGCET